MSNVAECTLRVFIYVKYRLAYLSRATDHLRRNGGHRRGRVRNSIHFECLFIDGFCGHFKRGRQVYRRGLSEIGRLSDVSNKILYFFDKFIE
ncbi:Uncharacterised protein [Vibrio cholerae]|nr:Uncharacterised protein [Vibrio cholerae]CSI53863.1 Uncharacterised protein [Vibrio cholerae]